jgi:peptide/nickel transport system permease protein
MVAISEVQGEAEFETLSRKKSLPKIIFDLMRRKPLGAAGAIIVLVMFFAAIFANFITSYDPVANSFADMTQAPSFEHLLGTDQFGRDLFSRII